MHIRPKTKKRLLILAGIALLIGALGFLGYQRAQRTIAAQLAAKRAEGMQAYARGDYETALAALSYYLDKSKTAKPDKGTADLEAIFAYGKSRLSLPMAKGLHLIEAQHVFETYLNYNPGDLPARHELLNVYTREGYQGEALRIANSILEDNPTDPEALLAKAYALCRQEPKPAYDEALKVSRRLNEVAPLDLKGLALTRDILVQLKTPPPKLIEWVNGLRNAHPADPRFELLLGTTYLALIRSQPAGATPNRDEEWAKQSQTLLEAAASRTPPDAEFVRQLVGALDRNGMYLQSVSLLETAVKSLADADLKRVLVQRLWESDRFTAAAQVAAPDPQTPGSDARMLGYRALALQQLGPAQRAEADGTTRVLAARNDVVSQAWAMTLGAQPPASPSSQSTTAPTMPSPREQVKLFQAILAKDPENAVASQRAGDAYAALEETDAAVQMWTTAASRSPAWGLPLARIARIRLIDGRNDEALAYAIAAAQRAPASRVAVTTYVAARFATLGADSRKEDLTALLEQVHKLREVWPADSETLPIEIALMARTGQKDAATAELKNYLASPDAVPTAMARLVEIDKAENLGQADAIAAHLKDVPSAAPGLALRRAQALLAAGRGADGRAALLLAQKEAGGINDLSWRMAIAWYLDMADDPAAIASWIALADGNPANLTVQKAALQAPSRKRDREFWKRSIDRLKTLTGDEGQLWRLEQCRWLLAGDGAEKDRSQAIATLTELARQSPDQFEVRQLLAYALNLDGKLPRAIEEMTAAARIHPDDVDTGLALAGMLRAAGKPVDAGQRLDAIARRTDLTAAQRRQVAGVYESDGAAEQAVAVLTAGDAASAADPARDGLLARLYRRLGRRADAEAIYARLGSDPAALPGDLAAGADYFAAAGKQVQADALLKRLGQLALRPGEKELILARYAERYGSESDAAARFEAAAAAAPQQPEVWRELAGFHLRRSRFDPAAAAADKGLAAAPANPDLVAMKQEIAAVRAFRRPQDVKPLVEVIARDPQNLPATAMLKLVAEAQSGGGQASGEIAAKLRALADQYPRFMPAQEQLIYYYLSEHKFDQAAILAERAMKTFPYDPDPCRLAAMVGAASGNADAQLAAATEWRRRSVEDTLPADLAIAEAMLAQNKPALAYRQLDATVRARGIPTAAQTRPTTGPQTPREPEPMLAQDAALYRLWGRAAITSGHTADAATQLVPLLQRGPQGRAQWLTLTSYHPDAASASAWIDRAAAVASDEPADRFLLAEAWQGVGSRFASVTAFQKSRDLVKPLLDHPQFGRPAWRLTALAAQDQGDYDAAVAAWRNLLTSGAGDPRVDPNLANNLAYVLLVRGRREDLPEALKLARAAVAADAGVSNFYDTLARIQSRSGDGASAITSFRAALEKSPDNVEAMVGLADELARRKTRDDTAEAKALLARINRSTQKWPRLPAPVRQQLETVRNSMEPADGGR